MDIESSKYVGDKSPDGIPKLQLYEIDRLSMRDLADACKNADEELEIILTAMFISLNQGSLCLKLTADSIAVKTCRDAGDIEKILAVFLANAGSGKYDGILTSEADVYKPLIMKEYAGLKYIYFQKYFHYEERLKRNIRKFIKTGSKDIAPAMAEIRAIINEESQLNGKRFRLNKKQKTAILSALLFNFVIISGGPGTGKTHIISYLLRCLLKTGILPERISIVSPTGKAAQKISHSIRKSLSGNAAISGEERKYFAAVEAGTIHRLLKYDPGRNSFRHNNDNRLDADILIIDEVSMVDLVLMSKLLDALPDYCGIILIGDKNQLPSVEAGAVLAGLIPDEQEFFSGEFAGLVKTADPGIDLKVTDSGTLLENRVIILDENFRSSSSVLEASVMINNKNKTQADIEKIFGLFVPVETRDDDLVITGGRMGRNGFFIDAADNNVHRMRKTAGFFFDKYFLVKNRSGVSYVDLLKKASAFEFDGIRDSQLNEILGLIFEMTDRLKILTVVREGLCGCNFINSLFREMLAEKTGDDSGYPAVMTHNDYSRNLFNGDTGVVLRDRRGSLKAVFRDFDEYRIYDYGFIRNLDTGFSITVHKSQGSEYDDVLIVLPDNRDNPLLTKEIIYTALTRSKRNCFIYGTKEIFAKSIQNHVERESGITGKLSD